MLRGILFLSAAATHSCAGRGKRRGSPELLYYTNTTPALSIAYVTDLYSTDNTHHSHQSIPTMPTPTYPLKAEHYKVLYKMRFERKVLPDSGDSKGVMDLGRRINYLPSEISDYGPLMVLIHTPASSFLALLNI